MWIKNDEKWKNDTVILSGTKNEKEGKKNKYREDTEPLYNSFMYSPTTSVQYQSIPCNAFIVCYNYVTRYVKL